MNKTMLKASGLGAFALIALVSIRAENNAPEEHVLIPLNDDLAHVLMIAKGLAKRSVPTIERTSNYIADQMPAPESAVKQSIDDARAILAQTRSSLDARFYESAVEVLNAGAPSVTRGCINGSCPLVNPAVSSSASVVNTPAFNCTGTVYSTSPVASCPASSCNSSNICQVVGCFSTTTVGTTVSVISQLGCNFNVTRLGSVGGGASAYSVRFNLPFCRAVSVIPISTTPGVTLLPVVTASCPSGFVINVADGSSTCFIAMPVT